MKKWIVTILLLYAGNMLWAQNSLSFYHLGNATFQHSNFNPSWVPDEGQLFIGLPVISGIHVHANNKLSYNELFTKNDENDTVLLDIAKALPKLQNQNLTSTQANLSLLHVGYRTNNGSFLSLFINERVESDVLYSEEIIDYAWRGNAYYQNEDVTASNVGTRSTYFREIGLGYVFNPMSNLQVGTRAKYLTGFLDASTPHNFNATLTSDGNNYAISGDWQNAVLRTSGIDIFEGEEGELEKHLINNQNAGFGLDIGATYHLSDYHSFAGSITDIGFIKWKEDVTNYTVNDTTFTYSGVDLGDDIDNIRDILIDSLFDKFDYTESEDPYTGWLPIRATGSWIYHLNNQTDVYATVSSRFVQRKTKMLYGAGITRQMGKHVSLSGSVTKLPQQFFNLGAAMTIKGGPVQFYMAADQIINFSVPDARAFDFRLGLNLIFGQRPSKEPKGSKSSINGPKGVDTMYFQGERVETKKRDGIYSVIKKQPEPGPVYSTPSKKSGSKQKPLNKVKKSKKKKNKVIRKSTTKRRFF